MGVAALALYGGLVTVSERCEGVFRRRKERRRGDVAGCSAEICSAEEALHERLGDGGSRHERAGCGVDVVNINKGSRVVSVLMKTPPPVVVGLEVAIGHLNDFRFNK